MTTRGRSALFVLRIAMVFAAVLGVAAGATAQVPSEYFAQNCAACHTVGGGPLIGPDLKNVTDQRTRQWLVTFMLNPKTVVDSGDPYARRLVDEAHGLVMPTLPGMTRQMAEALLDLIDAQSKQAQPVPAGQTISDQPFTAADTQRGRAVFTGAARLSGGGPACLACHNVAGVAGLGGGALGPDLTDVYTRLQGRRGLGGWLSAPPTPTMRKLFSTHQLTPEETEGLVAFFEQAATQPATSESSATVVFLLSGVGGALLGLLVSAWVWRGRFVAVRRRLVEAVTSGGTR